MSADTKMIIGSGSHQYEVDHNWAKLPEGKTFGYTHGVVEDKDGRIIISNQSKDAIAIFDADGNFIKSWGESYEGGAHGLTIHAEGDVEYLYLANTGQGEVVKTTLDGEVVFTISTPDLPEIYGEDKPFSPTETAIGPDGSIYVADGYGQSFVHRYDKEGKYVSSFGGKGSADGELDSPHGITIDSRGETPVIQISNRANIRIDNFTLDGKFIETVIKSPDVRFPCTSVVFKDEVYIPDLFARVSVFDKDNKLITHLGDYVEGAELTSWDDFGNKYEDLTGYPNIPHDKRQDGKFSSPHGLLVDRQSNIFVAEWIDDGRVTKLTRVKN